MSVFTRPDHMRPLIGITCDYHSDSPGYFWLKEGYASAVWAAGGYPLLLPPVEGIDVEDIAARLSGLVISGGDFDIEPSYYREEALPCLGKLNPQRSSFEITLTQWAVKNELPTLGICGGLQTINIVGGGTVYQDLPSQVPDTLNHEQSGAETSHVVQIKPGTVLAKLLLRPDIMVNSTHHQAIKDLAPGFRISALAPDGIIEATELTGHRFMLGVQWHPERLYAKNSVWLQLFAGLVKAARNSQHAVG